MLMILSLVRLRVMQVTMAAKPLVINTMAVFFIANYALLAPSACPITATALTESPKGILSTRLPTVEMIT